ncbi:MAG TPA: hypothetical protein VMT35_00355 [Ignavibacteriaceae bacterium]|nr:hypothetical protein [Ignavibacteriaceae bacterium]
MEDGRWKMEDGRWKNWRASLSAGFGMVNGMKEYGKTERSFDIKRFRE